MLYPHVTVYWGKARRLVDTGPECHPLAYHSLDVAAAGKALLKLRPQYLDAVASASQVPHDLAERWLLFAFALHDLGKYADCFQCKWRHMSPSTLGRTPELDPGHGLTGALLWKRDCDLRVPPNEGGFRRLFSSQGSGEAASECFGIWMDAVFGHHGRPIAGTGGNLDNLISKEAAADALQFVTACAALFQPMAPANTLKLSAEKFRRSSWLVAGLAMMADWIGSNQQEGWFPYREPDVSVEAYWPLAQERAQGALRLAGLSRPAIAANFDLRKCLSLAPEKSAEATPLQAWVSDQFAPSGQTLVIIEDLTGSGKTEAALIAAHRLMSAGAAEGLYWALPTMATANSLYQRLNQSYRAMFKNSNDASLVLAHGKRNDHDGFKNSVFPAGNPEEPLGRAQDDESSSAQCAAWIADDRRKTFLADVGVGTIDQALLGVLPAKHQAIRLAALARRVLVVDEVHSYDSYTGGLLQRLLTFQAAHGGSAILLTATLTQKLRSDLVTAFETGARWRKIDERGVLHETAFPLVTVVTKHDLKERPFDSSRGTRRDLLIARIDNERAAVDLLIEALEEGNAAVWIRNTVHDAVAAFRILQERIGAKVQLFHARFALGDRMRRETEVVSAFGKGDKPNRNRVLVATQVVEQALDLDFDVMISDLAPIDLLIQRAGRLHRHDRGHRPEPVLHVLSPEPVADAASTWFSKVFPKGQYVYNDHGQLWLTAKQVFNGGGLRLLSASPRSPIEAVFGEDRERPDALAAISLRAQGKALGEKGHAAMNALELNNGYAQASGTWASDAITPTRLGSPQRLLRLAKWNGSRLMPWDGDADEVTAWRRSEVQVLAAKISECRLVGDLKLQHEKLLALWGERYDPPLVVPLTQDGDVWRAEGLDGKGQVVAILYSTDIGLEITTSPQARG